MSKSKGTTKNDSVKTVTPVTQEEAKAYLKKMEQMSFIDGDDSDECIVADGDFNFNSCLPQLGFDSDNDCTTVRGDAESDSGNIFGEINDSPDFYDSEGETDGSNALKAKYKAARQSHAKN